MNVLYEAVMRLGRSIVGLDRYGWTTYTLVSSDGSMCINGLLTCGLFYGRPEYISQLRYADDPWIKSQHEVVLLAGRALIKTVPDDAWALALKRSTGYQNEAMHAARHGDSSIEMVETALVRVNDVGGLDQAGIRRWLSDALDLLAEELPIPAQPLFANEDDVVFESRVPETAQV